MLITPERIAANQANSANSSGPKTAKGKLASRSNSLKHGLTGAGLALPDEDKVVLDAAFNRHFEQMRPQTQAGLALTFKVALCEIRLNRFAKAESAVLAQRVIDAGFAFDDAQYVRLDEAKAKLHKNPEAQLAVLARFEVGVQWVIHAWSAVIEALVGESPATWRQPQYALFEALSGRSNEFPSYDDATLWNQAARGDQAMIGQGSDLPGDSPAARFRWARDQMIEFAEAESERWEALLEPVATATAIARANAIEAARYDGSKEGLLMKKYEAATTREMKQAIKDFPLVEAAFGDPEPELEPVAETPIPQEVCVEVGSFLPVNAADSTVSVEEDPETETGSVQLTQTFPAPASDRFDSSSASILPVEMSENRRS